MSRQVVQEVLDLLSERLDPYIQGVMESRGISLEWTAVLREIDQMRGKSSWIYSRRDLALQLRMLTERLNTMGYPFDEGDRNRTLSSYGSVLRIMRHRLSHGGEFEVFDALHVADTVRTVLSHIDDTEGASHAADIRARIIAELVDASTEATEPGSNSEEDLSDSELPTGSLASAEGLYGAVNWEPWTVVVLGEQSDLDSMRTIRARENVRSLIEDIADAEGPVHQSRVARLVGLAFGFTRLAPERLKRILAQIPKASVTVDSLGYVWPEGVDQEGWAIHRTGGEGQRPFEQISPVEIGNAAVAVLKQQPDLSDDDLRRAILKQFGRKRSSKAAKTQLELGIARAQLANGAVHTAPTGTRDEPALRARAHVQP